MKRLKKALLPALLLALLCAETALGYTTTSYTVDVEVGVDNSFLFTETIRVNYDQPQHGIYRYIPLGSIEGQRRPHIDQEWVDGWPYEVYEENSNKVFQIGDADRTVTGPQEFTFGYRIRNVDDKDTTQDLLYVDVLPTNWETPIGRVKITVHLPKDVDADTIEVYAGSYGSETLDGDAAWDYDETTRTIEITGRRMAQGEGITILCDLPEGYWEGQMNYDWTETTLLTIAPVLAALMLILWFLCGRDPHIVPTVEFYPPKGMTPAEVGYVLDGVADKKDLISLILYFAEQGYLTIEQQDKKKFLLHKQCEIPKTEKKYARTLFDGLFTKSGDAALDDLDEDFGESYLAASEQLTKLYSGKKNTQISLLSTILQLFGLVVCGFLMIAAILFAGLYNGNFVPGVVFGILGSLGAIGSLLVLLYFQRKALSLSRVKSVSRRTVLWVVNLLSTAVCAVAYSLEFDNVTVGIVFFGSLLIAEFCTVMMEKRTKQSAEFLGKILGLRQFIETAELDRLNRLVEENPAYYYRVLPYAYVMGLTDKWAKNFERIKIVRPDWYVACDRDPIFDAWMFNGMMRDCCHAAESQIRFAIPESGDGDSGGIGGGFSSGGGGFSGGGVGGGGGGSW